MQQHLYILLIVVNAYSNKLFTLHDKSNFLKKKIKNKKLKTKEKKYITKYNN